MKPSWFVVAWFSSMNEAAWDGMRCNARRCNVSDMQQLLPAHHSIQHIQQACQVQCILAAAGVVLREQVLQAAGGKGHNGEQETSFKRVLLFGSGEASCKHTRQQHCCCPQVASYNHQQSHQVLKRGLQYACMQQCMHTCLVQTAANHCCWV